jgi:hypothetical protein
MNRHEEGESMKAFFRSFKQPSETGTGQSEKHVQGEVDSDNLSDEPVESGSFQKKIIKYAVLTVLCYIMAYILAAAIVVFTVIFFLLYGAGGPAIARNFLVLILTFAIIAFIVIFILWYTFRRLRK